MIWNDLADLLSSTRRLLLWLLIGSIAFISVSPIASPSANADEFSSPVGPPSLTSLSLDEVDGTFTQFEPAWTSSAKTYELTTTVEKPGGIAIGEDGNGGLQNGIVFCLYLDVDADSEEDNCENSDNTGVNPDPDPQTAMIMTWNWDEEQETTEAADDFVVVDGDYNNYEDDGSSSNYTKEKETAGDVSATVTFRFKVSNAMRESTDWAIKVTADDGIEENPVAVQRLENLRTAYYGSIRQNRPSVTYSSLEQGVDGVDNISLGDYSANSSSNITFTASDFVREDNSNVTLDLAGNRIDFDCSPTSTFDNGQKIDINSTSSFDFASVGLLASEDEEEIGKHSCQLEYKGGLSRSDKSFSNSVTVAIEVSSITAPQNFREDAATPTSATLKWEQPPIISDNTYSSLGASLVNYVIEISQDGTNWQFLDRITDASSTVTYVADNLSETTDYDFRVTANTTESSGFTTVNVETGADAAFSYAMLQDLNSALSGYTEDTSVTTVVDTIEGYDLKVFASPTYGALAERMLATTGKVTQKGRFSKTIFDAGEALPTVDGFTSDNVSAPGNLNGNPFIGFVGFGSNNFYGSALMSFDEVADSAGTSLVSSSASSTLADVFRNKSNNNAAMYRDYYSFVLNANGTSVDYSNTRSATNWSSGMYSSDNGYSFYNGYDGYQWLRKFSYDDISLGISGGVTNLDGNFTGSYMGSNANVSYGVENPNGGDYQQGYYWGEQLFSNDYVFYFFIGDPTASN